MLSYARSLFPGITLGQVNFPTQSRGYSQFSEILFITLLAAAIITVTIYHTMLDIVHICYSTVCLHPMSKYDFHPIDWGLQILRSLPKAICCCLVAKSCPILCHPMDCSTPGFSVLHYLSEFAQTQGPLSQQCHPTISSSVASFSSCPQPVPE